MEKGEWAKGTQIPIRRQIGNAKNIFFFSSSYSKHTEFIFLDFGTRLLLLTFQVIITFASLSCFRIRKKKKKTYFPSFSTSIRQTQTKRQDHHFYFILNLPPFLFAPSELFRPTPHQLTGEKKKQQPPFLLRADSSFFQSPPPLFIKTNEASDRTDSSGGRRREESE